MAQMQTRDTHRIERIKEYPGDLWQYKCQDCERSFLMEGNDIRNAVDLDLGDTNVGHAFFTASNDLNLKGEAMVGANKKPAGAG